MPKSTAKKSFWLQPGDKVGELRVVEPADNEVAGNHDKMLWLLECDCGRRVLRTHNYLRSIVNGVLHYTPCCNECASEMKRGVNRVIQGRVHRALLKEWAEYGSLYSPSALDRMHRKIKDDLADFLGFYPDDELNLQELQEASVTGITSGSASSYVHHDYQQYMGFTPISSTGGWMCKSCCSHFYEGWGCLDCGNAYCTMCCADHSCRANNQVGADYFERTQLRRHQDLPVSIRLKAIHAKARELLHNLPEDMVLEG